MYVFVLDPDPPGDKACNLWNYLSQKDKALVLEAMKNRAFKQRFGLDMKVNEVIEFPVKDMNVMSKRGGGLVICVRFITPVDPDRLEMELRHNNVSAGYVIEKGKNPSPYLTVFLSTDPNYLATCERVRKTRFA